MDAAVSQHGSVQQNGELRLEEVVGQAKLACLATGRQNEGVASVFLRRVRVANLLLVAEFALPSPVGSRNGYTGISQEVCPWNVRFARENRVPEFAPRPFIAGKDARSLARDFLAMSQEELRRLQGITDEARQAPRLEAQRCGGARQPSTGI